MSHKPMKMLAIWFLVAVAIFPLASSQLAPSSEFVDSLPISRRAEVSGEEEYRLKFPLDSETLRSKSLLVTRQDVPTVDICKKLLHEDTFCCGRDFVKRIFKSSPHMLWK